MPRFIRDSKPKKIAIAVSAILICAAFVAGYYIFSVLYIRKIGINLRPSKDYPVHEVQYFLQNDPAWSSDKIGGSGYTMGGSGCLITCVASSVTDLGLAIDPKELNQKLTEAEGYQNGAYLIWYKLNEIIPQIDYKYKRVFSSAVIEKDLKNGLLPVVKVYYHGSGIEHWLLVLGAKDGEFLVFDPMNKEKEPLPLSVHGRVYAYRVIVKAE